MLTEQVSGKWIDMFVRALRLCNINAGDSVAVLAEAQSRAILVQLSNLALEQIGARSFTVTLPSPALRDPVAVRSTGASVAVGGLEAVIAALSRVHTVVDCTVEGMLHAPELASILAGGARLFMISNEHPEVLERLQPDAALRPAVDRARARLGAARKMLVTSRAGTRLMVDVEGAPVRGAAGYAMNPGGWVIGLAGSSSAFPRRDASTAESFSTKAM